MKLSGNIVDVIGNEIFQGTINILNGKINRITREVVSSNVYIAPGLIDAHVHIESSMLPPSEFARAAVSHGTVATVSDPHEIANVLGLAGIEYMIRSADSVPVKFYFSAPSCVPATNFETSGAELKPDQIEKLLQSRRIHYLGEMMNFPGVIYDDPIVRAKLDLARKYNKPTDGHSPGLSGKDLELYAGSGISTDHECMTRTEALEKIGLGMKILIREGSAAKNLDELLPVAKEFPHMCMFCTDDIHPDDLLKGHINLMMKRALNSGMDLITAFQIACLNPTQHYNLYTGLLQEGDPADLIVFDDPTNFNILQTIINGDTVFSEKRIHFSRPQPEIINQFTVSVTSPEHFSVKVNGDKIRVITVQDGQLLTGQEILSVHQKNGFALPDIHRDILKITVVNRYARAEPAVGFIKNFGLKTGAIASSVAHDSHNIVAVGTNDEVLCEAVNLIIKNRGGIAAVSPELGIRKILSLPIAGLMTDLDFEATGMSYIELNQVAAEMGSTLKAPFMTLSFMALLVIPELKLSDKGLFDGTKFQFVDLFSS